VTLCPVCRFEISADAPSCPDCGTQLGEQSPSQLGEQPTIQASELNVTIGAQLLERYRVIAKLEAGCYHLEDRAGAPCTLEVLEAAASLTPLVVGQLHDQLSRVRHPCFVPILEARLDAGRCLLIRAGAALPSAFDSANTHRETLSAVRPRLQQLTSLIELLHRHQHLSISSGSFLRRPDGGLALRSVFASRLASRGVGRDARRPLLIADIRALCEGFATLLEHSVQPSLAVDSLKAKLACFAETDAPSASGLFDVLEAQAEGGRAPSPEAGPDERERPRAMSEPLVSAPVMLERRERAAKEREDFVRALFSPGPGTLDRLRDDLTLITLGLWLMPALQSLAQSPKRGAIGVVAALLVTGLTRWSARRASIQSCYLVSMLGGLGLSAAFSAGVQGFAGAILIASACAYRCHLTRSLATLEGDVSLNPRSHRAGLLVESKRFLARSRLLLCGGVANALAIAPIALGRPSITLWVAAQAFVFGVAGAFYALQCASAKRASLAEESRRGLLVAGVSASLLCFAIPQLMLLGLALSVVTSFGFSKLVELGSFGAEALAPDEPLLSEPVLPNLPSSGLGSPIAPSDSLRPMPRPPSPEHEKPLGG
jgi:hypothetical protein